MNANYLLWCDLETTGTDPQKDSILEAAFVLTDRNFEVLQEKNIIFPLPEVPLSEIAPVVMRMHAVNGLWEECSSVSQTHEDISMQLYDWLVKSFSDIGETEQGVIPLAGNTVHFDRAFLKQHLPDIERRLHYRNFDVSTLKWFCVYNGFFSEQEIDMVAGGDSHRARDDVRQAINLAKWMKKSLRKGV